MKRFLLAITCILFTTITFAQAEGDTITVQAFNYNSSTRDTTIDFPAPSATTYRKILMQYSMRCKDGLVSTSGDRNKGCGEWDYSCNTNIVDTERADSNTATTNSHLISGFTGTTFNYTNIPTFNYFDRNQKMVTLNSTISETIATIGSGVLALNHVLHTDTHAGKSQYLFTQSDLVAGGISAGTIDALTLDVSNNPGQTRFFKVKLKETSKTTLSNTTPDLTGFTEVYNHDYSFATSTNRIQFHTPFTWDGTSNIIVELTFTNKVNGTGIHVKGTSSGSGIESHGDHVFTFNGSNYIESDTYQGVSGAQNRTVEAWIKTDVVNKEYCGWGTNLGGQKWLIKLDGNGRVRVEVNGGNAISTTSIDDNEWHHVAVVQSGGTATDFSIYIDGVLEVLSGNAFKIINTAQSMTFRVGSGTHLTKWDGQISEVRVWNTDLSGTEIKDWMYKSLDNAHTNYANLELYYPLNEGTGTTISDLSPNARSASVINGDLWSQIYGENHFKNFSEVSEMPNLSFHQGVYNLTVSNITVSDTVSQESHMVKEFQIVSNAGTSITDDIATISTNTYWEAGTENHYATNGALISSTPITAVGTINITKLPYFTRSPMIFEVMSFVTPYGIGLDLGMEGKTWTFDVTDYTPFLHGNKRIFMNMGGQNQEDIDIKFLYIVGTPERDVLDIVQLWKVRKINYDQIMDDTYFEPRDVMMHPAGESFKVRSMITGHGQEGEFIARNHFINVNGGSAEFNWQVWKTCGGNPVYPQGGTWVYDRAGWCPGMATLLQESDITSFVTPGQTASIDYGLTTASGASSYIVNHQLVSYGPLNHVLDASITDVINPSRSVKYEKFNPTGQAPTIILKNTGSAIIGSAKIKYGVSGGTFYTTTWVGYLDPLAQIEVTLPIPEHNFFKGDGSNVFVAEILEVNNTTDNEANNNIYSSGFDPVPFKMGPFTLTIKTNARAFENWYVLTNAMGDTIVYRDNLTNNTTYVDTLDLPNQIYSLYVEDEGGDGIEWWANPSQGSGSITLKNLGVTGSLPPTYIDNVETDFGNFIIHNFSIGYPMSVGNPGYDETTWTPPATVGIKKLQDVETTGTFSVYPNPSTEFVNIESINYEGNTVIRVYNQVGSLVYQQHFQMRNGSVKTLSTKKWSNGVYFITLSNDSKRKTVTFIKQ